MVTLPCPTNKDLNDHLKGMHGYSIETTLTLAPSTLMDEHHRIHDKLSNLDHNHEDEQ